MFSWFRRGVSESFRLGERQFNLGVLAAGLLLLVMWLPGDLAGRLFIGVVVCSGGAILCFQAARAQPRRWIWWGVLFWLPLGIFTAHATFYPLSKAVWSYALAGATLVVSILAAGIGSLAGAPKAKRTRLGPP